MIKRETKIGLSVLAAILLLYLSIAWVKRIHLFAPEVNVYSIEFTEVNGLRENDPVVIRGYPSGRVLSIDPSNQSVKVQIALDTRFIPTEDAKAEVQLKELMGSKQVALHLGSSPKSLSPGASIPGYSAMDFGSGLSMMTEWFNSEGFQRVLPFLLRMDSLTTRLNLILANIPPQKLGNTFVHLEEVVEDISYLSQEARSRKLIAQLDSSLFQVNQLLFQGKETLTLAKSLGEKVDNLNLGQVDSIMIKINRVLQTSDDLLIQAKASLDKMDQADATVSKMLYDKTFEKELSLAIENLNKVLEQIQNDKLYISIGKNKNPNKN